MIITIFTNKYHIHDIILEYQHSTQIDKSIVFMAFSILFVIFTVGPSNDRFRPQTLPCGPRTHLGNMLGYQLTLTKKSPYLSTLREICRTSDQNILSYYDKLTHKFHGFHFMSALIFGNLGDFPTLSITLSRLYCGKKIQTTY